MNKNVIDTERFVECLYELRQIVIENQGKNQPISFKKGFLEEQEGYKRKSYSDAKAAFKKLNYEKEGVLCGWLMDSLSSNNLIHWRDYKYLQYDAKLENLLYKIYVDPIENDELLFEEAIQFFGKCYPIISYIFFLKDMEKYLPVRPRIFQKRFEILGVDTDCLNRCTWKNYQTFCSMIGKVREFLNGSKLFKEDVELIDAHSFVWMMWLLEGSDEQSDLHHVDLRHDTENRRSVICDSEGCLKKYYGTFYERSRKNRAAAIAKHGCKCMVCGFDFKAVYGELGEGYIEVHHKEPLYAYNGIAKEVHPETDLVCLCSNCHSMIHRKKGEPMRVEELKALYDERSSKHM